jgi:hypothetical protein
MRKSFQTRTETAPASLRDASAITRYIDRATEISLDTKGELDDALTSPHGLVPLREALEAVRRESAPHQGVLSSFGTGGMPRLRDELNVASV